MSGSENVSSEGEAGVMPAIVFCNAEKCFNNKDQRCDRVSIVMIDGVCRNYPGRRIYKKEAKRNGSH